jgi:hypothetical protein
MTSDTHDVPWLITRSDDRPSIEDASRRLHQMRSELTGSAWMTAQSPSQLRLRVAPQLDHGIGSTGLKDCSFAGFASLSASLVSLDGAGRDEIRVVGHSEDGMVFETPWTAPDGSTMTTLVKMIVDKGLSSTAAEWKSYQTELDTLRLLPRHKNIARCVVD